MTTAPPREADPNYAHCESQLKAGDRAAWLAALFAPADKRPSLYALGAFALEIAAVRGKVREPLAGELRLQWWTDAIEGEARGDVRGHPVAAALIETIRRVHLPRATLTEMIEARREDLYDDPIASLEDYAKRADRIEGARIALAARALLGRHDPVVETAALQAGRAVAVTETFLALTSGATPLHMTVPLTLLRSRGIGAAEMLIRRGSPAIGDALADLRGFAEVELQSLRDTRDHIDPAAAAAFLTVNLAASMLQRTRKKDYNPFETVIALPQWRQQWIMWRAARKNGVF